MSQLPSKYRVTNPSTGEPVSFGSVYFYEAGTSTPAATYVDAGLFAVNTNPVILDANGEANVYLQPIRYKEIVADSNGAVVRPRDGIEGDSLTTAAADSRYVKLGGGTYALATTQSVIAHVRTYITSIAGISSYVSGQVVGVTLDAASVDDVGYKININGIGAITILTSLGAAPEFLTGQQVSLVYNGTNFILEAAVALLAGQPTQTLVTTGGASPVVLTATAHTVNGITLTASGGASDPDFILAGATVRLNSNNVIVDDSIAIGGAVHVDVISENVEGEGVTIDRVLLKDGGATFAAASGYGVGSGGSVTQLTSKSTMVTLSKASGQITMNAEALAAGAAARFIVYNALVVATDCIIVNIDANSCTSIDYTVRACPGTLGFYIELKNTSTISLSEAVRINFAVFKTSLT